MFRAGLSRLANNAVVRNSLTLMSGGLASQLVVFLLSPALSRVFEPAAFADLANFGAWTAVLALVGNLRYEHAVLVTADEDETDGVMALSLTLTLVSTAITGAAALALVRLGAEGGYLFDLRRIALLVPIGVLTSSVFSLLVQRQIRVGRFGSVTTATALQVISTVVLQIVLGLVGAAHSLILGAIAGYVLASVLIARAYLAEHPLAGITSRIRRSSFASLARRHVNFPCYALPADVVGLLSQRFVPVLVLAWFGATTAGLYAFAVRAVRLPLLAVAGPVVGALRKEAADRAREGQGLLRLFSKTTSTLTLLGIAPFAALAILGEEAFAFVFGAQWSEAGRMVEILTPGMMAEFISVPTSVFFLVTGTQHRALVGQAVGFGGMVGVLVAYRAGGDFLIACHLLAGVMVATGALTMALAALSCRNALHPEAPYEDVVGPTDSTES